MSDAARDPLVDVSARSRAKAMAAAGPVANWTILGMGGFLGGAVLLGLGLTILPPLAAPGALVGLVGATFLGLSTLRQAPIFRHLWSFGDRVLAVATASGVAAGAGVITMGIGGVGLLGQGLLGPAGVGTLGAFLVALVRLGGGLAVIGAVVGLTLLTIAKLREDSEGALGG
jgi:hypothetical protein